MDTETHRMAEPSNLAKLKCKWNLTIKTKRHAPSAPTSRITAIIRMEFRIGINLGDVIEEGERI